MTIRSCANASGWSAATTLASVAPPIFSIRLSIGHDSDTHADHRARQAHGDDTAGWRVVELLRSVLIDGVELHCAAHPIDILEQLQGISDLHVCDACRGGQPRGHLHRWQWPEFVERTTQLATVATPCRWTKHFAWQSGWGCCRHG